ncbi:hypothetical protein [Pseudalkalibacillus caeni]|uniref:hypothetical protein n=1 Tax=Exobacillus caeni TaxID=2574798 RepID=UPI001484FA8C|nr:hypothetical protein [Pseudalkalibacillus caeni]
MDETKGSQYEGRDKYFMDIDRMTNEGMAGGSVFQRYEHPQISDVTLIEEEEPPLKRGK